MLKFSGTVIWRLGTSSTKFVMRKYSSTSSAAVHKVEKVTGDTGSAVADKSSKVTEEERSGLVAAAFAALNASGEPEPEREGGAGAGGPARRASPKSAKAPRHAQLDAQITNATDINSLLLVAENPVVSRRHALKMVSVLSEWSSTNKVKISEFEKDPRFLKLCRILARSGAEAGVGSSLGVAEDLGTVLGVAGDDEAARLIMNLSLPQLIKVMKALQAKRRRSPALLRAVSHAVCRQPAALDLKRAADLLFCMASLSFPDPVLLDRICHDVIEWLPSNEDKCAAVVSILVSLGLLRYRHERCVGALAAWLGARPKARRPADVAAALLTAAALDFVPPDMEPLIEAGVALREDELPRAGAWLDVVFALAVLGRAAPSHLAAALRPEFIDKLLSAGEIPIPSRRKLMCLDAYAALSGAGAGVGRLAEHVAAGVPLTPPRDSAQYAAAVMDTFRSLVSADTFLRRDCDSGMGFMFDAEFAVDEKCHPVPLEKAVNNKSAFRIAVMCLSYRDMTRRVAAPLGHFRLYTDLLHRKGYRVLQIPYTELNPKDKLVTRVQYLQRRIRDIVTRPAHTDHIGPAHTGHTGHTGHTQ